MPMRVARIGILLSCLLAPAALAGEVRGIASAELLPGDPPSLRTVSRQFSFGSIYAEGGKTRYFLIEKETTRQAALAALDDYTPPSQQVVSIREVTGGTVGPVLHSLAVTADEVRTVRLPILEAENWGCCVQANTLRSFDIFTGRLLSVRSSDLPIVTMTRLGEPAIGYQVQTFKAIDPMSDTLLPGPAEIGLITLLREDVPVQQLVLKLTSPDGDVSQQVDWLIQIGWARGAKGTITDHFVLKASEPSGMFYIWTVDETTRIAIPFTGERLDITRASLPPGMALAERPLE